MQETRSFLDIIGDTIYQYFDVLRAGFRYVFAEKRYRVTYDAHNGYPSLQHYAEEFTADNDRIARRHARVFAQGKPFKLEQIRVIKAK